MTWKTTTLVTISHQKGDILGLIYAYYGLIVYCLPFIYLTLMLRDRHLHTWVCCGSHLVHELVTKYLKRLIAEPRPSDGPPSSGFFDGPYGMPSQHVSCNTYVTIMVTLILFYHYRGHGNTFFKISAVCLLVSALWIQCLARVHLKYHDFRQVFAGLAYGAIFSLINFVIIEKNMRFASRICQWPIFRILRFKPDFLVTNESHKIHSY